MLKLRWSVGVTNHLAYIVAFTHIHTHKKLYASGEPQCVFL